MLGNLLKKTNHTKVIGFALAAVAVLVAFRAFRTGSAVKAGHSLAGQWRITVFHIN